MQKTLNYPENSMLIDVRYRPYPEEEFEVIYRNPETNMNEVKYEPAVVTIFFLKPEFRTNKKQLPWTKVKDRCYPVKTKYSKIASVIAKEIGGDYLEFYNKNKNILPKRQLLQIMNDCPWVFKSDFPADVYFRLIWLQEFGLKIDITKTTYAFLDIETDVLDNNINPGDTDKAPQPVNAISLILPEPKICILHVLGPRDKAHLHPKFHRLLEKQQMEYSWLLNNKKEFIRQIMEDDLDNKKYLEGYEIKVEIFDFKDEIKMIKHCFDYINHFKPNFCLAWNAPFDFNYLKNRIEYLGYDPIPFFIPPGFKSSEWRFEKDKSENFQMKTNRDWFYISSFTTYVCQMRLFAAIRKSQSERRSYSLSSVGKDTAKIDKLTQTKSGSFRQFAYTDFIKFLLYNIRDTVVQLAVEKNVNDTQTLINRSYRFATPFSKCFQETHIVRNCREYYFEKQGIIQANRLKVDPNIDTAFKGAFVADPAKNAKTGLRINSKLMRCIIIGSVDADAKAYYPSTKIATNQDPATLLYKCKVSVDVFTTRQCINKSYNQEYYWYDSKTPPQRHEEDLTGPIMNSYKNNNILSVCSNWLNIPTITDCVSQIEALY